MKNDVVYVVSGFSRTGSSMMMDCLSAGGLPTYYDEYADALMRTHSPEGYDPNPNGFFQYPYPIDAHFYEKNKGKVIKVYFSELLKLPEGKYKIVFIKRNPQEIRASMHRWTPFNSWGTEEVATYFYDQIMSAIEKLGLDITFLNYKNVVAFPIREFTKLSDWGIDINKAVSRVNPALHRLKLEQV